MLKEIISARREDVLHMEAAGGRRKRTLYDVAASLGRKPVIAEVKKASPSAGVLDPRCDPAARARLYQENGAGAISVLTETRYFGGTYSDLQEVCNAVSIPVLCKDFIVSRKQIDTACIMGADMILLIAAVLNDRELEDLSGHAHGRGLEILYEIHRMEEFARIAPLGPRFVGVNARDLATLRIDNDAARSLMASLPGELIRVAESGINTAEDVKLMACAGAGAFLVGTALMRSDDPALLLRQLSLAAGGEKCS